jgi:hypothetical protein
MWKTLGFTVVLVCALPGLASARVERAVPFEDGLWSGGLETGQDGQSVEECWARTAFDDGTVLTLAERGGGGWHMTLSNPGWQLSPGRPYGLVALVDTYPAVPVAAEAVNRTRLEFANIQRIPLLGFIENGHTIDLKSDGFNAKYGLEGSAMAIAKVRSCFAH